MVIRKYTDDLSFVDMEVTDNGAIHTSGFRLEYLENKWYIRVLKTYTNNNADQVPYWAKLRIFPKELKFIGEALTKAVDMKLTQVGIHRCSSGVLSVIFYDE